MVTGHLESHYLKMDRDSSTEALKIIQKRVQEIDVAQKAANRILQEIIDACHAYAQSQLNNLIKYCDESLQAASKKNGV